MPTVYGYNASDGIFYARDLDGNAQTADNYASGFFGFIGAAADATHIYAFNNAADEVVIWDRDWTVMNATITPNSPTDSYRGIALSDTHLILLNHTANQLEFYSLTGYIFESALTVSLDTKAWGGAARGADYLFLGNNTDDDIERRSLDGTADIDFSTGISFALQSLYASDTRVWAINRTNGTAVAFEHDGTGQSGDNHAWGSGNWQAAFVQPDEAGANTAPAFADASYSFDDVAIAVGEIVGTVAATDADNDTLSYTLTGTDASTFAIDANGQITVAVALTNSQVYSFNVVADDGTDTTSVGVSATAIADTTPALTFGSETIVNQAWEVGTAITSLTLPEATDGTGTITYSLSPTVPAGITFSAGNRRVSGTPTGRFALATFTYTATDGNGATAELTFTIVVTADAITFASTIANQARVVGSSVSFQLPIATGGVGAKTYSLTPATPAGITFIAATRVLIGMPTGRFPLATFTYTATDAEGITQTQTFTFVVTAPAIVFNPTSFSDQMWQVNMAVSLTLPEGSGGVGDLTASLTGTLPSGISFTASTRALAGNPSAEFASATFTYTMTDTEGESESISFTIFVDAAPPPAAGYFYDVAELVASEFPNAELPVIVPNAAGDDAIAKRATRSIARSLLLRDAAATYTLIQSLLDYGDLLNRPTIPTLRNAAQTYALIQSLLNYNDLSNRPTILSAAQVNTLIAAYGEPFTTALLGKLNNIEANADVTDDDNVLTALEAMVTAQQADARSALGFISIVQRDSSKDISQAVLRSAANFIDPRGITWDGTSVLVTDTTNDAVWGFTNGAYDSSKDISQAVLQSAASNIAPEGITWDGTSVLVLDHTNDAVWGFTNGAYDSSKDVSQAVLRSAASNIQPSGITWDGTSVLVLDHTNDAVWGFTNGAYDSSKDVSQAVLRSAASTIVPQGITWDGTSVLVVDHTNDAVWGFTNGAYDSSKDVSQALLRSAAGNIAPLGITWDGTSVLVVDQTNDAVWGFTPYPFDGSTLSAI